MKKSPQSLRLAAALTLDARNVPCIMKEMALDNATTISVSTAKAAKRLEKDAYVVNCEVGFMCTTVLGHVSRARQTRRVLQQIPSGYVGSFTGFGS